MLRIREVEPLRGATVRLTLSDGRSIERDLAPLLNGAIFKPIRGNPEMFQSMSVVDGTISWPGNLDLDPDMVIWGGPPPADERLVAS